MGIMSVVKHIYSNYALELRELFSFPQNIITLVNDSKLLWGKVKVRLIVYTFVNISGTWPLLPSRSSVCLNVLKSEN